MNRDASLRELREFGLLVGSVFIALGGWWQYRQKFQVASIICVVIGLALVVFGLIAPRALRLVHHSWMSFAEGISFVMTRVILFLVFFFVVTPIGMIRRLLGADPLRRRSPRVDSYWEPYAVRQHDPTHYENMF